MPIYSENRVISAAPEKCIGCKKCEIACAGAHIGMPFREAKKRGLPVAPRIKVVKVNDLKFPLQCRHCEDAPCANACPFGALQQVYGMVRVKESLCMGCKMCVMACPFGAIEVGVEGETAQGRPDRSSAKKCDLCQEWRATNNKEVCACVEACPKNALQVVDLKTYRQNQARVMELAHTRAVVDQIIPPA